MSAAINRSILIIEDDDAIMENLKEILSMDGYFVYGAVHGREALDILKAMDEKKQSFPKVILLDLNMPVMPGREFLNILRTGKNESARIPVIVMTAVPGTHQLESVEFMKKPLDLDHLLNKLNELCH